MDNNKVVDKSKLLEKLIEEAEEIEAEIGKAKKMYDQAYELWTEKSLTASDEMLDQAIDEVDNAKFQKVLKVISSSRSKFITARKIGTDVSEAMEFLDQARKAMKNNDYVRAIKLAKKSNDSVEATIESQVNMKECALCGTKSHVTATDCYSCSTEFDKVELDNLLLHFTYDWRHKNNYVQAYCGEEVHITGCTPSPKHVTCPLCVGRLLEDLKR